MLTRMHSSRMRTARSSSHQGRVFTPPPVRCPSTSPLGMGLDQVPVKFPLGCGPGDTSPPGQISRNFPLGSGPGSLQGMLGYHSPRAGTPPGPDPPTPEQAPPPRGQTVPPCGQTDTCKNINLRKLRLRAVITL